MFLTNKLNLWFTFWFTCTMIVFQYEMYNNLTETKQYRMKFTNTLFIKIKQDTPNLYLHELIQRNNNICEGWKLCRSNSCRVDKFLLTEFLLTIIIILSKQNSKTWSFEDNYFSTESIKIDDFNSMINLQLCVSLYIR